MMAGSVRGKCSLPSWGQRRVQPLLAGSVGAPQRGQCRCVAMPVAERCRRREGFRVGRVEVGAALTQPTQPAPALSRGSSSATRAAVRDAEKDLPIMPCPRPPERATRARAGWHARVRMRRRWGRVPRGRAANSDSAGVDRAGPRTATRRAPTAPRKQRLGGRHGQARVVGSARSRAIRSGIPAALRLPVQPAVRAGLCAADRGVGHRPILAHLGIPRATPGRVVVTRRR